MNERARVKCTPFFLRTLGGTGPPKCNSGAHSLCVCSRRHLGSTWMFLPRYLVSSNKLFLIPSHLVLVPFSEESPEQALFPLKFASLRYDPFVAILSCPDAGTVDPSGGLMETEETGA